MNDIAKPVDERLLYSKIVGIVRNHLQKIKRKQKIAVDKVQNILI
jgi:hypothetical protein